jgi:MFS family permease
MLLLPFFFKKYGFKKTILFGMLAWVVRYALFSFGDAGELFFMLIFGIALHGICYDFFFVSGQIYTDSKAGEKVKSAAQGLITLATYGIGMLIGFWIAGKISDTNLISQNNHDWYQIWMFPAIFAFVVMLIFIIFFKNENIEYNK